MSPNPDLRTGAMSHRAFAILMKTIGHIAEECAAADGSLPGTLVHGKLLKMFQVNNDGVVLTTDSFYYISMYFQDVGHETYHSLQTNGLHFSAVP